MYLNGGVCNRSLLTCSTSSGAVKTITDDRLEHEEPGLKKTAVCTHDWSATGRDALDVHMKVV